MNELLDQARLLAPSARVAFLDQHCADPAMRATIERSLSRAADTVVPNAAASAATPAGSRVHQAILACTSGTRIGPWTLGDMLGAGGSATVYRATRDLDGVRQEVAVKLLRNHAHAEDTQRMFRRERQSLAALSHPNIAHFIDAGVTEEGIAYLVMEYIDGVPITEFAAKHALDVPARLRLMSVVCHAVESAHRSLIVHRDLKPSNILVNVDGDVKVLDFGIAKLLDAEAFDATDTTLTGHACMTPAYAAPEQFSGSAISTATDVYALGMILHELLLGERADRNLSQRPSLRARMPASGDWPRAAPPTVLHNALRGDLDNILGKALAEEPPRRYARAGDLADDLERHLDARPVSAHPPSFWYRSRKFVRRHRGGVASSVALLITLLAGLVIVLWQATAIRHASMRANAMRDFMVTAFSQASPGSPREGPPRITDVVHEAIGRARADTSMEPGVRTELLTVFGVILREQGALAESIEILNWTIDQARTQIGIEATLTRNAELERLRAEVDAQSARNARTHADQLLEQLPDTPGALRASVLVASSTLALRERDYDRAGQDASKALADARKLHNRAVLGEALGAFSEALYYRNDLSGSVQASEELLALRESEFGPQHWRVATVHANLSRIYRRLGDLDSAERHAQAALAIDDAVLGPDDWRRAQHLNAMLMVHRARNDYEAALAVARETLRVDSIAKGENNTSTFNDLANVGFLLLSLERANEALPALQDAHAGYLRRFGPHYFFSARTRAGVGMALALSGKVDAGLAELRAAMDDFKAMQPPEYDGLAEACEKFARVALALDRTALGASMPDCIDQALANLKHVDDYWIGRADLLRAEFALRAGNANATLTHLDHAAGAIQAGKADPVVQAESPLLRAAALRALGRTDEAATALDAGRALLARIRYPPQRLRLLGRPPDSS